MDMHSGGGRKLDWEYIYIEAPLDEAKIIFYNRFGRNPYRVTCTCCGEDYSLTESKTLAHATGYERGCKYVSNQGYVEEPSEKAWSNKYVPLEQYIAESGSLFLYEKDILPNWRVGNVPNEGYVWVSGDDE